MGIKGTKTEKNLLTAFAGESQARNRYTYFSGQAKKEGYVQIADIFAETADQEKEHAKRFFKFLEGGDVEIVSVAEKQHERRYRGLLANVESGTVFKKDKPVVWRCRNCGYLHEGTEAPEACPACAHPKDYFEVLAENW